MSTLPQGQPATREQGYSVCEGRVDLWLIRSPGSMDDPDTSDLDDAERRRIDSFIRPADRLMYATAHIGLRRILAGYTQSSPRDLRFLREPCPGCGAAHGRPALEAPSTPLHFSLSHSGGMALVGIAAVPIGVDVEKLPSRQTVEDCSPALHPGERSELAGAKDTELKVRFGQIWTRKEAYLKGIGTGLSRDLAEDYLGTDAQRHPPSWSLLDVPCGPTHCAAAAVQGPAPDRVSLRQVPRQWLGLTETETGADPVAPFTSTLAC
ncbi:4'-phosphopantetheinyl transferase family protein [Streptomyces sp. NPDC085614]|uniref:4'-phosphopantetheinyl transferase family protein n=1 Tax=Streptomyces sp. NPDC085614 TaxID=3365733 RepID=UPI0037D0D4C0